MIKVKSPFVISQFLHLPPVLASSPCVLVHVKRCEKMRERREARGLQVSGV